MTSYNVRYRGEIYQYDENNWIQINALLSPHALIVNNEDLNTQLVSKESIENILLFISQIQNIYEMDPISLHEISEVQVNNKETNKRISVEIYPFKIVLKDEEKSVLLATISKIKRKEWIQHLSIAKNVLLQEYNETNSIVSNSEDYIFSFPVHTSAFTRFASSDSEDYEDVSIEKDVKELIFTIQNKDGNKISTTRHLSEVCFDLMTINQIKCDAITQLRIELQNENYSNKDLESMDAFTSILTQEDDYFVLYVVETGIWCRNETQLLRSVLKKSTKGTLQVPNPLEFEIQPQSLMPAPKMTVNFTEIMTKWSDTTQKSYAVYKIEVQFNDLQWYVLRRYKEFYELHTQLSMKYSTIVLPILPPRTLFTPTEGHFVMKRKALLNEYINKLLEIPSLSEDVHVLSFLGSVSISRDQNLTRNERPVVHISALEDVVEIGDIILFSCQFGMSILQRRITRATYDHVGIIVPGEPTTIRDGRKRLRILEATGEGIQVYSLLARLMVYSQGAANQITVRQFTAQRTQQLRSQLNAFTLKVHGGSYSIFSLLHQSIDSLAVSIFDGKKSNTSKNLEPPRSAKTQTPYYDTGYSDQTSSTSQSETTKSAENMKESSSKKDAEKNNHRKYFCSSLVASALQHIGWLDDSRSSSYFWPGSFEEGGEIEQYLTANIKLGPEVMIDCRIVEVHKARSADT